jgi:hypothetical protein
VVGLAARNQEARERLGQDDRAGLRAVGIEVAQGRGDVAPVSDDPRELLRRSARPAW